jgi:hypothetical protein
MTTSDRSGMAGETASAETTQFAAAVVSGTAPPEAPANVEPRADAGLTTTTTLPAVTSSGPVAKDQVLPAAGQLVTCPECGTAAFVTLTRRDATDFCRNCDYPLFWAPSEVSRGGGLDSGDESLRRLPGTVGQVSVASLVCPVCAEPNAVTASVCIRCGSSLYPVPLPPPPPVPVAVAPPPPPAPEPEPVRRGIPWWVWVIIGVVVTALLVVIAIVSTR